MKHVIMCERFPLEAVETNIIGTQNVVDLALKHKVPKMITISTDKAASPVNVMGATKFIAEKITLNANNASNGKQAFSCVRFGNVANSRGSVIPVFLDALLNRRALTVSDPEVTRFVMEIPDAVKLIIKATSYARGGEIFLLRMKSFRLGELVDVLVNTIAPELNVPKASIEIKTTGLAPIEKLHEELISATEYGRTYELDDMYVVLPSSDRQVEGLPLRKPNLPRYTSDNAELISHDELVKMVRKHSKGF